MQSDALFRQQALDPNQSFIVQAPAGSGKTSLLVQRYLGLLAGVNAPEEILAITFTRKAAAEMKGRVLEWLSDAAHRAPPGEVYLQQSWELAKQALERDRAQGWNLLANPARMRIMTVDAFNSSLAARMPLLSRSGAAIPVVDDAEVLYREAARRLPQSLGSDHPGAKALETLLVHLDNNVAQLEELMVTMLSCRDHWIDLMVQGGASPSRARFEGAFSRLIAQKLESLASRLSDPDKQELFSLGEFCFAQLGQQFAPPSSDQTASQQLWSWTQLASLFLTKSGVPRKRLNKLQGITSDHPQEKSRALSFLQHISEQESFVEAWWQTVSLPTPKYSDEQWGTLAALFELLPVAAAQLQVVFRERRQMDFIGVSQAALSALGDDEDPTDLALALDYRIQHILVDEFQDTSAGQYQLLSKLIAGWSPDDGRSLFCVGDPMQSIYRFRQAEVGLFLQVVSRGLPSLPLTPLRLSSNFRSDPGIVDWVNEAFAKILPKQHDLATSAVSYAPSQATRDASESDCVTIHPFFADDRDAEAQRVADVVSTSLRMHPKDNLAVLVRSRSHLHEVIPALKARRISFQAVEIDALPKAAGVQDLLSLTHALQSLGRRTAWLSILRAPWCGLVMQDLDRLMMDAKPTELVWDKLGSVQHLSDEAQQRIQRVYPVLEKALAIRGEVSLHNLVEQTWIALGGPACLASETDLVDVQVFFELLRSRSVGGDVPDSDHLQDYLEKLYTASDPKASAQVQLMTIHKAKGLEFDSVVLPGLGRGAGIEDQKLLRWLELSQEHSRDLLIAPVAATGSDQDPMYQYLRQVDRERDRNERARLLYVATTRAKKRLHVMGFVNVDQKRDVLKTPRTDSLLWHLWPAVEGKFNASFARRRAQMDQQTDLLFSGVTLSRLPLAWKMPAAQPFTTAQEEPTDTSDEISFHWVGSTARHVGTVVHQLLQLVGEVGVEHWDWNKGAVMKLAKSRLARLGVAGQEQDRAVSHVLTAIQRTLDDDRGQWVLSKKHSETKNEYPLTGEVDGVYRSVVIDRTFVDDNNVRWIVDYKTSRHEGSDVDAFLDNEQLRYQEQMALYGQMLRRQENRAIQLALYFPLLSGWREWSYDA